MSFQVVREAYLAPSRHYGRLKAGAAMLFVSVLREVTLDVTRE